MNLWHFGAIVCNERVRYYVTGSFGAERLTEAVPILSPRGRIRLRDFGSNFKCP